jgi:hypothetical protein
MQTAKGILPMLQRSSSDHPVQPKRQWNYEFTDVAVDVQQD